MKVFISGISGTGMGPLALMARATGMEVYGTDLHKGAIYPELIAAGIEVKIGAEAQDGKFLREKLDGLDWFVYTSALPEGHAELKLARESGVKCTKRDDFTAFLIEKLGLKLVAVAGTHGKTTTTAMIIWAARQLGLPVAYIVGSTLSFAPSGAYDRGDKFFVYEADEYDRNFLKFRPWLAVLPAVSYDHPDIYATLEDYEAAFRQFCGQSREVVEYGASRYGGEKAGKVEFREDEFGLAGEARRRDAALAGTAILKMVRELANDDGDGKDSSGNIGSDKEDGEREQDEGNLRKEIIEVLNSFPGVGRRFERLAEGIYTDYAHHPEEIVATIEMAREEAEKRGFSGVTVIYEPHQNSRQHEVRQGYARAFLGAERLIWLPTYLTREEAKLAVLTPQELIDGLENKEVAEVGELGEDLFKEILSERERGRLVILMTAGPADEWLRGKLD